MDKIPIPPIDHTKDSVGEAFGVDQERMSKLLDEANNKLLEMKKAGESIGVSKKIEIILELAETTAEGILMIFGIGSQHGAEQAIQYQELKELFGSLESLIGNSSGSSKPGESKEV
jgi:hypothetical protein